MQSSRRLLRFALAISVLAPSAILTTASSPSGATPSSGITAEVLAQGQTDDQVHLQQTGGTNMVFERITIQPGGSTGWHYHLGPILAVVDSGTLTHYDDHCGVETYIAGQAFEELPGSNRVHMGTNLGDIPVVLAATYVVPAGDPLKVDAPAPSCAQHLK